VHKYAVVVVVLSEYSQLVTRSTRHWQILEVTMTADVIYTNS